MTNHQEIIKEKVDKALTDLIPVAGDIVSAAGYMFVAHVRKGNFSVSAFCRILGVDCNSLDKLNCLICPIGKKYLESYLNDE